jgi:glycosyltransferase involved in cell wall biosynthesis
LTHQLRIAIVYDRIFPASYGGVERWFRVLAEALAGAGHSVTYLTTDHWPDGSPPVIPGVEIIPLAKTSSIYTGRRRRVVPLVTFGAAVSRFLVRHGTSFDVVHSTAMSPLAAQAVVTIATARGYVPVLDWWEVWGLTGWNSYLGLAAGCLAARLERRLARSSHLPLVYSELHRRRLATVRGSSDALFISGVLPPHSLPPHASSARPFILIANRLIPEKQTAAILPALRLARQVQPSLEAIIVGSGPLEAQLRSEIARAGLDDSVTLCKNLSDDELATLMGSALCLAVLSRREGYGLVALEAMRHGTPALILDHPDSAATERITEGENGLLVPSLNAEVLASAILSLHASGTTIRERTLAWRIRRDRELTIHHSLPDLVSRYRQGLSERRTGWWRSARP